MPTTHFDLAVRPLPPADRHARIFALLDALAPADELILVNDHDPRPVRYQVQATQPDCFAREARETASHEPTVEGAQVAVKDLPGVQQARLHVVWIPPLAPSTMSEAGRREVWG